MEIAANMVVDITVYRMLNICNVYPVQMHEDKACVHVVFWFSCLCCNPLHCSSDRSKSCILIVMWWHAKRHIIPVERIIGQHWKKGWVFAGVLMFNLGSSNSASWLLTYFSATVLVTQTMVLKRSCSALIWVNKLFRGEHLFRRLLSPMRWEHPYLKFC